MILQDRLSGLGLKSALRSRVENRCAVLGFIGLRFKVGKLEGGGPEAVSKLPKNVDDGDFAWLEDPVDFIKCAYGSMIPFPRSEIAATIQCLMSAYRRF